MLRQMERSTIKVLAKRGKSIRQIASELGHSPTTIVRVLREPVEAVPGHRQRRSQVDVYGAQIRQWLAEGLPVVRMLELVREDPEQPYGGSRSRFGEVVQRLRQDLAQAQAVRDVPIRFEGLPGEYLQVDWGEIRQFPFMQAPPGTRYFLACRLKYSRWVWVRWTEDMRQETLFRGLVDCLSTLGWVPWVLVFDNMKTVTSGRDTAGEPIWTPALRQLAGEYGFHPQACDPGAGNQKGAVESLVKWVKSNLLPGRHFADDRDLAEQTTGWQEAANQRPSAATGIPPCQRLGEEAAHGGVLPATAADFGLYLPGLVSPEALVAVRGNRYSVPIQHVGAPVIIRVHATRVRLWRDQTLVADHRRAPDGARQRVVHPEHFAPLFGRKPRAQAMLYRDVLVGLGGRAPAFLGRLCQRHRDRLGHELLALYALYERYGAEELLAAMALADDAGTYEAAALALLLEAPRPNSVPPLAVNVPGLPSQAEVDRRLSVYEAWVVVDVATAWSEVAR
jgi:transposase